MKQRGLVVFLSLILAIVLIGCGSKQNEAASGNGKAVSDEAQRVAEKFGDLLISKCPGGYVFSDDPHKVLPSITAWANASNMYLDDPRYIDDVHSKNHFLGYEWKGEVEIGERRSGSARPFDIYKRGGKWFYHPGESESDVPIDLLQPVRPDCPKP